jgi:hypothetical protein
MATVNPGLCGAVLDVGGCSHFGTVGAAEKPSVHFDSVTDNLAVAVFAGRSKSLDRTFKTVERMSRIRRNNLESLIVFVATNFALRHYETPLQS